MITSRKVQPWDSIRSSNVKPPIGIGKFHLRPHGPDVTVIGFPESAVDSEPIAEIRFGHGVNTPQLFDAEGLRQLSQFALELACQMEYAENCEAAIA